MKEPVVGRSVAQVVFGRFVGVVRSVESLFVGELAVGCWAVFERRTRFGRWNASGK